MVGNGTCIRGEKYAILVLQIAVLLFGFMVTQAQAARVVAEKRECAICHIAWIADFKRDDIATLIPYEPRPMVDTGRQDVVSTERMCFSCHDGYVLDSRFLWQDKKHTHPVGVVPSERVEIPKEEGKTIFPLNDEGKVYCGTCHSAHGVEWGDKQSPVFLRAKNIDSSLCMTCHVDRKGERNGKLNHPLHKEVSKSAKDHLAKDTKLSGNNEVICQSCHKVHGSNDQKLLVLKNDRSQLCATCHVDKSFKEKGKETNNFTHPVDVVPEAVEVDKQFEKSGVRFGPNNEIECQTCHQIHLAPSEKLLALEQGQFKNGICIKCHTNKQNIEKTGHNILAEGTEIAQAEKRKYNSNLGVCGVCHNAHGGSGPKMWARKLEPAGDRVAALCLSCHKEGGVAEEHPVGKYSHPVGAALPPGVNAGKLPLYTRMGGKTESAREGLVSCPTCHDIHGPPSRRIPMEDSTKEVERGKYLRKGEGDLLVLCKTCHEDKWTITETRHDLRKSVPTTPRLGICGYCHQVHNGNGPRMWARDADLQDRDPSVLCLNCHSKSGPAEKKQPGNHSHPIDVSIEDAGIKVTRKGRVAMAGGSGMTYPFQLPLYDENGRKIASGSGKVSCATCHDPHKWESGGGGIRTDKGGREDGDARNSFLRTPAAPNGELCITCHRSKATVLDTDHDLSVTVPEATNALDETLIQSGVCGQCHAVHNAETDLALWGRRPGRAENGLESLCRSCHIAGEIAQSKTPRRASHPGFVLAWDGMLRDADKQGLTHLPVFSDSGEKGTLGHITCPTCHNVHQWRPDKEEPGTGKNEEGDVFSSFLRLRSSENMLCADCHGPDSLYRYKYFHGVDFQKRQEE